MMPIFIVYSLFHSFLQVNYTEGGREMWNTKWIETGLRVSKYLWDYTGYVSKYFNFVLNFFSCTWAFAFLWVSDYNSRPIFCSFSSSYWVLRKCSHINKAVFLYSLPSCIWRAEWVRAWALEPNYLHCTLANSAAYLLCNQGHVNYVLQLFAFL